MEKTRESTTNIAKFCGRIVNLYQTDKVYIVTVATKNTTHNGTLIRNYPKIYFFKGDDTGVDKFLLHDDVSIEAHVSSSVKTRPNGTTFFSQAFIGEKIEPKKSLYEKELGLESENRAFEPDLNIVYLKGVIESVEKMTDSIVRIRINAKNKRFNNHVNVTSFRPEDIMFSPGDTISVHGYVRTTKKEKGGMNRYYENIVANKIDKTEEVA